jgi:hypothetical protein
VAGGTYAEWFNRRHERSGHLFRGRFKLFIIDKETYSAEVLRYVVLNPVRAKIVARPEEYRWSSYRATAGLDSAPAWLDRRRRRSSSGARKAAPCGGWSRGSLEGRAGDAPNDRRGSASAERRICIESDPALRARAEY